MEWDRFLAAIPTDDWSIVSPAHGTTPVTFPALGLAAAASLINFPVTPYADTAYLEAAQEHIWQIIKLDGRFGDTELAPLTVQFFRSVHQQLGSGTYATIRLLNVTYRPPLVSWPRSPGGCSTTLIGKTMCGA